MLFFGNSYTGIAAKTIRQKINIAWLRVLFNIKINKHTRPVFPKLCSTKLRRDQSSVPRNLNAPFQNVQENYNAHCCLFSYFVYSPFFFLKKSFTRVVRVKKYYCLAIWKNSRNTLRVRCSGVSSSVKVYENIIIVIIITLSESRTGNGTYDVFTTNRRRFTPILQLTSSITFFNGSRKKFISRI